MIYTRTTTVNGVLCTHHRVSKVEYVQGGALGVWLDCWQDEQAALDGLPPAGRAFVNGAMPIALVNAVSNIVTSSELLGGAVLGADKSGDLETHRRHRWAAMQAACIEEELSTFTVNDVTVDCDERSRRRILEAVTTATRQAAGSGYTRVLTVNGGATRTLTRAQLIALGDALDAFTAGLHAKLRTKGLALQAATTVLEVQAVVW